GDRVAVTIQRAGRSDVGPVLLRAHGLTNRETEVALAVLRGESSKQIAAALFLSPWTVQDHLKAIFAKTGVRSRRELSMRLFTAPAHHPQNGAARG
ncbi:MAG: helix-turn-helix transcriptional regulator, partial [Actinomycetota bacterium]